MRPEIFGIVVEMRPNDQSQHGLPYVTLVVGVVDNPRAKGPLLRVLRFLGQDELDAVERMVLAFPPLAVAQESLPAMQEVYDVHAPPNRPAVGSDANGKGIARWARGEGPGIHDRQERRTPYRAAQDNRGPPPSRGRGANGRGRLETKHQTSHPTCIEP